MHNNDEYDDGNGASNSGAKEETVSSTNKIKKKKVPGAVPQPSHVIITDDRYSDAPLTFRGCCDKIQRNLNLSRKEKPTVPTSAPPSSSPPNYGTLPQPPFSMLTLKQAWRKPLSTDRFLEEAPKNPSGVGQHQSFNYNPNHGQQLFNNNNTFNHPQPSPGCNILGMSQRPKQQPEHPRGQRYNPWAINNSAHHHHPHNMTREQSSAFAPSPSYLQTQIRTPVLRYPCIQEPDMSVTVGQVPQLLPLAPKPPAPQVPQSSSKRGSPYQPPLCQNTSSSSCPQHPHKIRARVPPIQLTTAKDGSEANARRLDCDKEIRARKKARGNYRLEVPGDIMWSSRGLSIRPTRIEVDMSISVNPEYNRHGNAAHVTPNNDNGNHHDHGHEDKGRTTCSNGQGISQNQNRYLNKLVHQPAFHTETGDQDMDRHKRKMTDVDAAPPATSQVETMTFHRSSPPEFNLTVQPPSPVKSSTQPNTSSNSESDKESDVDLESSPKRDEFAGSEKIPLPGSQNAFANTSDLNYARPIDSNALHTNRNENSSSGGIQGPNQSAHRSVGGVGNISQNFSNKYPGGMEVVKKDSLGHLDGCRGHLPDSQPLDKSTQHPRNEPYNQQLDNQQLGPIRASGSNCTGVTRTPSKPMKKPQNERLQSASDSGAISGSHPDWTQPVPVAPDRYQQLHTINELRPIVRPNVNNLNDNINRRIPAVQQHAKGQGPGLGHETVVHGHGVGYHSSYPYLYPKQHFEPQQQQLMLLEQQQKAQELGGRNVLEDQERFQGMNPNFPAHFQQQQPRQEQEQQRVSCCVREPSAPRPSAIEQVDQRQQQHHHQQRRPNQEHEKPQMCIPVVDIYPMDCVRLKKLEELGVSHVIPLADRWSSSVVELESFFSSALFHPT